MHGKWPKRVALVLFGVIGAAVFLEVGLRMFGAHRPIVYQIDPAIGFRLKPNQHTIFFGNELTINRFGVRDARPFESKAPNTLRVLVLGDSVTWGGVQLPQQSLFTQVLEHELGDAEVINAGINGYSVWRMAELYRRHLTDLKPDLIVFYVIPGDFYRAAVVDLTRSSPAFPLEQPAFALSAALSSARILAASQLKWAWLRPSDPARERDTGSDHERLQRNVDAIRHLNDELLEGQRLVVVVSPFRDHPDNPPFPPEAAHALDEAGIETLILNDDSLRVPENFVDHIHLSAQGHARVGRRLAEFVRNVELGDP